MGQNFKSYVVGRHVHESIFGPRLPALAHWPNESVPIFSIHACDRIRALAANQYETEAAI